MASIVGSYQTLIVSRIPVTKTGNQFRSQALWSLDINTNADVANGLWLLCPVLETDSTATDLLNERIKVFNYLKLADGELEDLVQKCDVVEIPGNFDWAGAAIGRRVMRLARKNNKFSILGISSNRAKTTLMNAAGLPLPRRVRAMIRAASIRASQRYLARNCDAVRVVGQGLVPLVSQHAKTLRVDVASWIREDDIRPPREGQSNPISVVIASRLEPMKGVTMGMEAVIETMKTVPNIVLDVIGVGAEEMPLRRLAKDRSITDRTRFLGQLDYPNAFFAALRDADYVLLTNLNDEQPRLIFDAISQGAIPICPNNAACGELGLEPIIYYKAGSAASLSETLKNLIRTPESELKPVRLSLIEIAKSRTIKTMHEQRREWVLSLLQTKRDG